MPSQMPLSLSKKPRRLRAFVAGFGFAEFAQQFFLPRRQSRRGFDVDLDNHIAASAPLQHGHTRAALAQLLARLDAFGDR